MLGVGTDLYLCLPGLSLFVSLTNSGTTPFRNSVVISETFRGNNVNTKWMFPIGLDLSCHLF